MTSTINGPGRLGNHIIRNLAVSLIAEKHDLYVDYSSYELIKQLGINLFIGKNKYDDTIILNDYNYFDIYNKQILHNNLNPNHNFFQTNTIINFLYNYLNSENIKTNIINNNPFKDRYNNNNDLCIHIRLSDYEFANPGINYYMKAIQKINYDNLFICTDSVNHCIINQIVNKYPNAKIINYDLIQTMQFASTCKHIILSQGSFSSIIGYLSFYSFVNYPTFKVDKWRFEGLFSINSWKQISHD
jgi:hypothetical protein